MSYLTPDLKMPSETHVSEGIFCKIYTDSSNWFTRQSSYPRRRAASTSARVGMLEIPP